MSTIRRGFILAPMILAEIPDRTDDGLFHRACTDAWAVILKMYEYNHLMWGGVDPNAVRMENGRLWVHPSVCEELHLTEAELQQHLDYWQRRDLIEFQPIRYRWVDAAGSMQMIWDGEGECNGPVHALRLKYQPRNQYDSWQRRLRMRSMI